MANMIPKEPREYHFKSGEQDIFNDLNKNQGKTIILITHSKEIAEQCPRIVTIKDGEIINDSKEVLS